VSVSDALAGAIQTYNLDQRTKDEQRILLAERERAEILERFPMSAWPSLPLERYALGQEDSTETYSRWLEFRSQNLGSMRGGSAHKHIIYKHDRKPGWHFDPDHPDEQTAWEAVRAGFVQALELAVQGRWLEIDGIAALRTGAALTLKTLHIYFPEAIVPIYSRDHLRKFYRVLTESEPPEGAGPLQLNRAVLGAVRATPGLESLPTLQIQYFLYRYFDPRQTAKLVKVAPGHDAELWPECLNGGFICIGWDDIGDLSTFETKDEFAAEFSRAYSDEYKGHGPTIARKGNEVWMFRELEPGDLVLANRGTSEVLALGRVVEPGYAWDGSRTRYKNTVRVDWDTSYARTIPARGIGLSSRSRRYLKRCETSYLGKRTIRNLLQRPRLPKLRSLVRCSARSPLPLLERRT
jgi:5-methylcytosine-specific restriction protein B